MKNYKKLYEELRQAIDGGYALATHEDALESVRSTQRKPLTDEQIDHIAKNYALNNPTTPLHFARAIEAAHGIKE